MANYKRIKNHQHYYRDDKSGRIQYRRLHKGELEIYNTGETQITRAHDYVKDRQEEKRLGSSTKAERARKGITNPLISTIWDDCIAERSPKREPATVVGYDGEWRNGIEGFWGKLHVGDVTQATVKKYENWYLKHNPNRTFFNTRKYLRMLFRYMKGEELIKEVPSIEDLDIIIATRTKKKKVGRVYSDQEIKDILIHANKRTVLGVRIGRFMGPRKMEILELKWEHIHFDAKDPFAEIWSRKNKEWRNVPIPDQALQHLKNWQKEHGDKSPYVFYSPRNPETHIRSQVFDKDWTRAKVKAKIKNATVKNAARVHDLRHTFATQTAIDGWPPALASYALDMSIEEYMRTYVHVQPEDVFKFMKRSFASYEL